MYNLTVGDVYLCEACEVKWAEAIGTDCWFCGGPGKRVAIEATTVAQSESELMLASEESLLDG